MKIETVPLSRVRAFIAECILGGEVTDQKVGNVTLLPHQSEALVRVEQSLAEFGGVLLADPVGTGKTYVALATVGRDEPVVAVGPAVLRDMWESAAGICCRTLTYISFESLSRGKCVETDVPLVIVDEAHHARNPATRRFTELARLVSGKKVVLMSATPIHNRREDLISLLSLFMGSRAAAISDAELARVIVRRARISGSDRDIPTTRDLRWLDLRTDHTVPSLILSLPPPLPVSDGGDGGALVAHSLIRQWMSSDAALIGGLKRRLVRAEALLAALENDTWPSASELSAWISGDDTVQLALPGLLAGATANSRRLVPIVAAHRDALIEALEITRRSMSDTDRAQSIIHVAKRFSERKIVVFSQYADSIEGLFPRIAHIGGVAALTGSGGMVSGGAITRREILTRFAPRAHSAPEAARAEKIDLLLTTDLLSEGVNLQDAGVVIHLDFPWTPARMEQRLGRVARIGSLHSEVFSFAFRPPVAGEAIVEIERILRHKMREAGVVTHKLPSLSVYESSDDRRGNPSLWDEEMRKVFAAWMITDSDSPHGECIVSTAQCDSEGFLALTEIDGKFRLVAERDGQITEDPRAILECAESCKGGEHATDHSQLPRIAKRIIEWLAAADAVNAARPPSPHFAVQRRLLKRLDAIVSRSAWHSRPVVAMRASRARDGLLGQIDAHRERALSMLGEMPDDDVIDEIIRATRPDAPARRAEMARVRAVIVIRK